MGGSSKNSSSNNYKTNYLGTSTTKNPYVTSTTNNNGTTSSFKPNTAMETIYNSVNQNIGNLLNEYINPTLESNTNKALLNNFANVLQSQSKQNLENNIINPLTQRNMIRSSQATDLYKKEVENTNSNIANFANNLLANSQANTADMITNLLNAYLQGYNIVNDNQAQSLATSKSNGASLSTNNTKNSGGQNIGFNASNFVTSLLNAAL